ncbi:MAG TPA: hypothetical protein PLD54_00790 [Candidatus Levybacteria bacterium]|nr:hypothetical protein [Candidatus Levybacteria bacterium]
MNGKKSPHYRIGFDFDKVFVHYPPLIPDSVINWLYKKKSKTLKYRMPGQLEQKIRILSHFPLFRHPVEHNIFTLKKLSKKNYPLFLISGRLGFLDKRTAHWMKKFPIEKYFQEIHFNFKNEQSHLFKNKLIQSLKITHYIDDDLDLLLYLAKHNPSVKFYWLDTGKISKRDIPFENIKKVQTISEIPNI